MSERKAEYQRRYRATLKQRLTHQCVVCGAAFGTALCGSRGQAVKYCSPTCEGEAKRARYAGQVPPRHVLARARLARAARGRKRRRVFTSGPCPICGVHIVALGSRQACSWECSAELYRRKGKGKRSKAQAKRLAVFNRDGYRCALCKKQTKRNADAPHPRAPTVDHIVPSSRGGTDELANLQCACFSCNVRKSNGYVPGGEQLRLIG